MRLTAAGAIIALCATLVALTSAEAAGPCPSGRVALTFDDGPQPGVTELVLDQLAARDVRATFFVIGGLAATYPELVARTADEGHFIGNHSWAHERFTARSDAQIRQSITQTGDTVRAITGRAPALVRPPYGSTSARVQSVISELGLTEKMWTVSSGDTTGVGPDQIAANVLTRLHPGAVVLQHDNQASGLRTAAALPQIIDGARERGYCFGVLDDHGRVVASTSLPSQHVTRLAGTTRYETAARASRDGWPHGAPAAVVVTGERFADGLAAAPLAGALDGPILLSRESSLPSAVADELRRLGPSEVMVVGPLDEAVAAEIAALGPAVTRLRAQDRYETAELLAETATTRGADPSIVVIATGVEFPDALSSSVLAASGPHPLLLTFTGDDPGRLEAAVARLGASKVLVVGGPAAVPDALVNGLGDVERLAGAERTATAAAVATHARAIGMTGSPLLASAERFPDALVAGPLASARNGPLLLTAAGSLSPPTLSWIRDHESHEVTIVGGSAAVSAPVACTLTRGYSPSFRCPQPERR